MARTGRAAATIGARAASTAGGPHRPRRDQRSAPRTSGPDRARRAQPRPDGDDAASPAGPPIPADIEARQLSPGDPRRTHHAGSGDRRRRRTPSRRRRRAARRRPGGRAGARPRGPRPLRPDRRGPRGRRHRRLPLRRLGAGTGRTAGRPPDGQQVTAAAADRRLRTRRRPPGARDRAGPQPRGRAAHRRRRRRTAHRRGRRPLGSGPARAGAGDAVDAATGSVAHRDRPPPGCSTPTPTRCWRSAATTRRCSGSSTPRRPMSTASPTPKSASRSCPDVTTLAQQHDCLLLDLDGTVFRGHEPTARRGRDARRGRSPACCS